MSRFQDDKIKPVVREFVFLVDQNEVRIGSELAFDGGGRDIAFGKRGHGNCGKQQTDDQGNKPFHVRNTPYNIVVLLYHKFNVKSRNRAFSYLLFVFKI